MTITLTREEAQQVLDALEAALSNDQPYIVRCKQTVETLRNRLAQPEPSVEPYGQVTVVKRPGCVEQHWFYRWPEPPYLDNAAECHTVYTAPPQRVYCSCGDGIVADDGALCGTCVSLKDAVKQEPVAWHEPGSYSNVTVHKKWAKENKWLPLYKEKNT